jgi:hypothetical protein
MSVQKGIFKRMAISLSRKRTLLILTTIVITVVIVNLLILSPFLTISSKISDSDLRNYSQEYLTQYRSLVEVHFSQLIFTQGNLSNFPLYLSYPNKIVGVISRTHGAALFFDNSQTAGNETNIKEIPNPIEYYVWPFMPANTSELPWVLVKHADSDYILDSPIQIPYGLLYVESGANLRYTGFGHAFNITGLGATAIFGSLIEENRMILKGSNDKKDWSVNQADLDSLSAFISDCTGVLNNSDIDSIRKTYESSFLLSRILSLIGSGAYRDNPWLFTQDYERLKQAGADNTTLSKVQTDYMDMQEKEPLSLADNLWTFFVDHILGGMIFGSILGGLIVGLLLRRESKKGKANQRNGHRVVRRDKILGIHDGLSFLKYFASRKAS